MEIINRGGLFPLSDNAYFFFMAVEGIAQSEIAESVLPSTKPDPLANKVVVDEDVQHLWTLLSGDIQEHADKLLREIVCLWVTMRGFAIAASWLEDYQIASKKL